MKQIDNYILNSVIGNGQFGQVYQAEHIGTKESFAIKQMDLQKFERIPKLNEFI